MFKRRVIFKRIRYRTLVSVGATAPTDFKKDRF